MTKTSILKREGKPDLAYIYTEPSAKGANLPQIVFLGGFKSDMSGTKAIFLEDQCKARGQGYLRLDYAGHGLSGGKFKDGIIGSWKDDALDVIDHLNLQAVILVGSSMGGWISLVITMQRPQLVKAMIGIAAAPDFTDDIWLNRLNAGQRDAINRDGYIAIPSEYSAEPYIITKALIENGRENFVLDKPQSAAIPMVLLQGMRDDDVPWQTPEQIKAAFSKCDVDIVLVEDGDHRLSRPEDLAMLNEKVLALSRL